MRTLIFSTLSLFSAYYLFVILFLLRGLKKLKKGCNDKKHSFSVITACRNEEGHIEACLRSVFAQDYPGELFSVIVVDDRSADRTPEVLKRLRAEFSRLSVITLDRCPEGTAPKKHALSKGIEQARGEILLFTDADCRVPPTWISAINRHFDEKTGTVSGLTTYFRPPSMDRFFWGLQAMDFFSHSVVSAAAIGAGLPLNTNANNFAVRRSLYDSVRGFTRGLAVVSGDDDLLLQAAAREGRALVRYAIEKEAAVETAPTPTLRGIWEQRKRWGSKTIYYNKGAVLFLTGIFFYYLLILVGLVVSFAWPFFVYKTLLDLLLAWRGMRLFRKTDLLPYFPPASILHIPLIILSIVFGVFGRFTWKGATTKKRL